MSLKELQEELKEQIKEAEAAEDEKVEEQPEETPEQEEEKETPEKEEIDEPKVEENKEETKEEKNTSDEAFYQLRRDKAAAEKRAADLEAKLAAPKEEIAEDAPYEDPELKEIKQERIYAKAEREFTSMENEFKRTNPEYGAVAQEYGVALAQSIRIQNPRLSEVEITERTKKTILEKAGSLMSQGYNPIEEMYHQAKELGFTGKSFQKKEEPEAKEELRPDMKKVAENRKKSSGMTAGGGESKGQITKQAAVDYTNAEWAKLPAAEKQRLLYG